MNNPFSTQNHIMAISRPSALKDLLTVASLACAAGLFFTGIANAATASFSTNAPPAGASGISNLTGHVTGMGVTQAKMKASNAGGGDDNAVYLDNGRPIQGQTFKTSTNSNGYQLTAVSLRQVTYDTYALVPDMNYHIRVTIPAAPTLKVLAEETAFVPEA